MQHLPKGLTAPGKENLPGAVVAGRNAPAVPAMRVWMQQAFVTQPFSTF